jgi:hypothetical protein
LGASTHLSAEALQMPEQRFQPGFTVALPRFAELGEPLQQALAPRL